MSKSMDHLKQLQKSNGPNNMVLQTSHIIINNNNDNNLFVLYKTMEHIVKHSGINTSVSTKMQFKLSRWNYVKSIWENVLMPEWIQTTLRANEQIWKYKFDLDCKIKTAIINNEKENEYQLFILVIKNNLKDNCFMRFFIDGGGSSNKHEVTSMQFMKPTINHYYLFNISELNKKLMGLAFDTKTKSVYYVQCQNLNSNKFQVLSKDTPIKIPTTPNPNYDDDGNSRSQPLTNKTDANTSLGCAHVMWSAYLMLWNKDYKNPNNTNFMIYHYNNHKKKISLIQIRSIPHHIDPSSLNCCFASGNIIIFFTWKNIHLYFMESNVWFDSPLSFLTGIRKYDLNLKFNVLRNKQTEENAVNGFIKRIELKLVQKLPVALSKLIGSYYCIEHIHLIHFNRFKSFDKNHLLSWTLNVDDLFF